jgi:cyclopropane fatty-acyl-phospholipid synthase-like methyltransferase
VKFNARPSPFELYTARELWTDEHTSQKMLEYHLNEDVDISSRNRAFIERSVGWIAAHFGINPQTRLADFGCGPGLYTTRFAALGAGVTGIDFSERSIRYAAETATRKGLSIDYVCRDYLTWDTEKRFDLITLIMCDFSALSPTQRQTLLTLFRRLLAEGGAVLLDIYSLKGFEEREEVAEYEYRQLDGFWSPEDYYGFHNTFKYEDEKVVLDKYTIVEAARTWTVYNWLQYLSLESLRTEFAANGLEIVEYFADVAGTEFTEESTEFAVVARPAG